MQKSVITSFVNPDVAARAVGALVDQGVQPRDISIYANKLPVSWEHEIEEQAKGGLTTTTGRDAAAGAAKGATIGLGVGVLAGIAAIMVPGFGIVLGGAALAGAAGVAASTTAAGAIAGGVTGYLMDQGVDEETATYYNSRVTDGAIVLRVDVMDDSAITEDKVKGVLSKYTGEDDYPVNNTDSNMIGDKPRIFVTPQRPM